MSSGDLRVLIVSEHASAKFGGEAALPLHYFRVLRKRNIEAWLVVHERTRDELSAYFPEDFHRIYFVADTVWHRFLWKLGKPLPQRLSYFTVEFILRLMTQLAQRRIIKQIIPKQKVSVIHQPMPVSPKEPSMIFGLGVPVVIGPMNGGMNYPPAFQHMQSKLVDLTVSIGRRVTDLLNILIPGKRQAAALLVANSRTRDVLPRGICSQVIELAENGVDLSIWSPAARSTKTRLDQQSGDRAELVRQPTRFVYVGRLINWKAVDLLLTAVKRVAEQLPVTLEIIGEGPERIALEQQAQTLGLRQTPLMTQSDEIAAPLEGTVRFVGWLSQADCAKRLQQSDVMVLPSLLECGGAAVLEAMAMKLPVIAARWGGPADYVNESCGILVDPTSQQEFVQGLVRAMIQMAESPELRRSLGESGRRQVLNHFDWEVKVNAVLEIYRRVIESTPENQRPISTHKVAGNALI